MLWPKSIHDGVTQLGEPREMPEIDDAVAEKGPTEETETNEKPPKNIVICSDGTGNAGGQGYSTNVWQIYNAIDINGHREDPQKIPEQVAFHDDGVGTESWKPIKAVGGAFGFGLSRNIRQLYTVLVKNFNPGDRIYLFGFSRGAFTVRSLAGLIASQGILDIRKSRETSDPTDSEKRGKEIEGPEDLKRAVKRTYRKYRAEHRGKVYRRFPKPPSRIGKIVAIFDLPHYFWRAWDSTCNWLGEDFTYHENTESCIRCIGVWDTVGAVGVPMDWLREVLDFLFRNNFHSHDFKLKKGRGYHALAIDDERKTFHPVMWKEGEDDSGRVKQVWFAGVHSNVGGGYPKQGLAQVSLHWMMSEIKQDREGKDGDGLRFIDGAPEVVAARVNAHDMLYNSRKGMASLYRYGPRDIAKISDRYCYPKTPLIHVSVFERIYHHTHAYAPGNVPQKVRVVSTGAHRQASVVRAMAHDKGLEDHYDENKSLLEKAAFWVDGRRIVYVLSLVVLVTFAYNAARTYNGKLEASWPFIPEWAEKVLRSFYDREPGLLIVLSVSLAFLFLLRTIFRHRARFWYGRFWWKGDDFPWWKGDDSLPGA
jgi:uncharacterized protein (DUF2235 family)